MKENQHINQFDMIVDEKGMLGKLPANINKVIPHVKKGAPTITALIKESGRITGYQLSSGQKITKEQGVFMAKQGDISGVVVAERSGSEYLRSAPDGKESNNLGNLPTTSFR